MPPPRPNDQNDPWWRWQKRWCRAARGGHPPRARSRFGRGNCLDRNKARAPVGEVPAKDRSIPSIRVGEINRDV